MVEGPRHGASQVDADEGHSFQQSNRPHFSVNGLRWFIAALLCAATIVNYLHRQLLSVLAPLLRQDLHLSNTQYSYAIDSFLISYAVMFTIGGWIVDRLNTRRGLALSLGIWSLASLCHAFVIGIWDLCLYRFLLGASEPGNFTAGVKAVSAWFPTRERGIAIGLVVSGTGIGAVIAPPLALWLALHFGWRAAFLVPSFGGLLLLPLWWIVYREPARHPWLTLREREHIFQGGKPDPLRTITIPWSRLMHFRQTWAFIAARFFADPLGNFYWFWIPSFLVAAKGVSLGTLAKWLWVPYVLQGVGQLSGGYFSGLLIQRGLDPLLSRKLGLTVALVLSPIALLALGASRVSDVLIILSIAMLGMGWWGANYNSALMDAIPQSSVSSVSGLAGTAGALSSVLLTWFTGYVVDRGSYAAAFWVTCSLMVFSVGATWFLLRRAISTVSKHVVAEASEIQRMV
jgi:MFS transporter, ACS family, hexuronate transporter